VATRIDAFNDEFSQIAFESSEKTWLFVELPRRGETVLVNAVAMENAKQFEQCDLPAYR
jgi:hypothetical protein